MQAAFGATPQDVVGCVRPLSLEEMIDFALIEGASKVSAEIIEASCNAQHAGGGVAVAGYQRAHEVKGDAGAFGHKVAARSLVGLKPTRSPPGSAASAVHGGFIPGK